MQNPACLRDSVPRVNRLPGPHIPLAPASLAQDSTRHRCHSGSIPQDHQITNYLMRRYRHPLTSCYKALALGGPGGGTVGAAMSPAQCTVSDVSIITQGAVHAHAVRVPNADTRVFGYLGNELIGVRCCRAADSNFGAQVLILLTSGGLFTLATTGCELPVLPSIHQKRLVRASVMGGLKRKCPFLRNLLRTCTAFPPLVSQIPLGL